LTFATALWTAEMGLVAKMLSYDSRNFHAWHYRREVVKALEELKRQELGGEKGHASAAVEASMAEQEFEYTTKMIRTNLSNFSAWHNRTQLIPRLLDERQADDTARRKMLDDEIDLITQALYTDPYDQSLWFYHQYLMTTLSPKVPERALVVRTLTRHERMEYLDAQLDLLKDMLDGTDDCKWIYQALLTTSQQYLDLDAGNERISTIEMRSWLQQLRQLDPLRKGRWDDWSQTLNL